MNNVVLSSSCVINCKHMTTDINMLDIIFVLHTKNVVLPYKVFTLMRYAICHTIRNHSLCKNTYMLVSNGWLTISRCHISNPLIWIYMFQVKLKTLWKSYKVSYLNFTICSYSLNIHLQISIWSFELSSTPWRGTGKNVENHVWENIKWILFKTRIFYIFLDIQ